MGYQIKITHSDGSVHLRKKVYQTKAGADKKANWFRKVMKPTIRVVKSHS